MPVLQSQSFRDPGASPLQTGQRPINTAQNIRRPVLMPSKSTDRTNAFGGISEARTRPSYGALGPMSAKTRPDTSVNSPGRSEVVV